MVLVEYDHMVEQFATTAEFFRAVRFDPGSTTGSPSPSRLPQWPEALAAQSLTKSTDSWGAVRYARSKTASTDLPLWRFRPSAAMTLRSVKIVVSLGTVIHTYGTVRATSFSLFEPAARN
jgi:hypothetical protein